MCQWEMKAVFDQSLRSLSKVPFAKGTQIMDKMYYLVIVNRSGLRASAKCLNCKLQIPVTAGQWCKVTKYIYLSTVLKHNFELFVIYLSISNNFTSTPLKLKCCTFTPLIVF